MCVYIYTCTYVHIYQRRQRKRKIVGKDLEQWMFLILRTGSSVGFAAGDCEVSVGFAAGYREQQVCP